MIERIKVLHDKGFVHCDIKPGNFLINNNIIYLIDFGISHSYIRDNKHIRYCKTTFYKGTKKYSSINSLYGFSQSRRDDLESLGYLFMSLLITVPWINSLDKNEIALLKQNIDDYNIPKQLKDFIAYSRKLQFNETPDYDYLKMLLLDI